MPVNYGARLFGGTAIALGVMLVSINAGAQDGTIAVSAQVVATCIVVDGGASLQFGEYNPANPDLPADTAFVVRCTTSAPVTVSLGAGGNLEDNKRRMSDGTNFLEYVLYQDAGHSTEFGGNIGPGDSKPITGTPDLGTSVEVHGVIPTGQTVPTGNYSDSVQISLDF